MAGKAPLPGSSELNRGRTTEPHMNQDAGPAEPHMNPFRPKAREGSKVRKADEAPPQKASIGSKSGDSHKRNEGRVGNSSNPRGARPSGVKLGESSVKQSPLHSKAAAKSSDSIPSSSSSSFDGSKGRAGKPRHKPTSQGVPDPTRGPTVPEFGNWAQSDEFTDVFKEIQREREGIPPTVVNLAPPRRITKQPKKGCCCLSCFSK